MNGWLEILPLVINLSVTLECVGIYFKQFYAAQKLRLSCSCALSHVLCKCRIIQSFCTTGGFAIHGSTGHFMRSGEVAMNVKVKQELRKRT
jgi:hypothetical protein